MRLKSREITYEAYPAKLIDSPWHYVLFLIGVCYVGFVFGLIVGLML